MRRSSLFVVAIACIVAPALACAQTRERRDAASSAIATAPAVQPEAVAALERMSAYLRGLKQFGLHADTTIDLVTDDEQKLQFPGTLDYKVRAPDRLYIGMKTDRKERELFYDGKTLTVYGPRNKLYAQTPAPPTIAALLGAAEDRYGIELPLADLFLWGTAKAPTSSLRSAAYVGPARIDGSVTDQYAFRQDGVDWQIWIEAGDKPLPRRLVITTTADPAQPQYASTLTWNTNAKVRDADFAFVPPKDAHRIEFVEVDVVATQEGSR
ncbi:DUF2092 domain-containing protein [Lysobacter auxotrophicus]|uniref:DUF2092 domain-containing protein n=1 Tax=Lysobacter auxotrophicus TaxID=2992573 RepID=A0ABM8DHQ8_9GAMM|nr:DUF2092 domain-containing protein [Lysobacter auxotrophicus]BDU18157.1 DUF2092 domain-containing protein [Lysobacter auxotrophicus]